MKNISDTQMSNHSMTAMKLNAKGHLISINCDTITAQQSYVKKKVIPMHSMAMDTNQ